MGEIFNCIDGIMNSMKKHILVIGAKGMLGQELLAAYQDQEGYIITAWDREEINVTDAKALEDAVKNARPDIIYNAVAYNAVDLCENDKDQEEVARALNVTYPRNLATIASGIGAIMVHYSSDYVFDGKSPVKKTKPENGCCGGGCCSGSAASLENLEDVEYSEADHPNPLSVYGQSKYDGEQAVEAVGLDNEKFLYYIIRLSKLFGKPASSDLGKKSFFDVMLAKGKECEQEGEEVSVVDGELSKFTYAPDLAQESKKILEDGCKRGIYHVVNEGAVTWYEGVQALYKIAGIHTDVVPVGPEEFPRPAKRPSVSTLAVTKRKPLRHYEDALLEYLEQGK